MDKEDKGHLSRDDLMAIPELAINPLADRIVDLFLPNHVNDSTSTQCKFLKFCEVSKAAQGRKFKIQFRFWHISGHATQKQKKMMRILEFQKLD